MESMLDKIRADAAMLTGFLLEKREACRAATGEYPTTVYIGKDAWKTLSLDLRYPEVINKYPPEWVDEVIKDAERGMAFLYGMRIQLLETEDNYLEVG